ncbi:hypothetical protein FB45DRAFT_122866 [Roridomyces roridus]|uniref:Uncharacterized protein n=1 Tax=Roridomyces roridus TaxID=1738132 RepID=A0AAD7FJB2_9AGAR|nr:hypothetical protein FB45DRAFT_122866 [Roridomyces roridus]
MRNSARTRPWSSYQYRGLGRSVLILGGVAVRCVECIERAEFHRDNRVQAMREKPQAMREIPYTQLALGEFRRSETRDKNRYASGYDNSRRRLSTYGRPGMFSIQTQWNAAELLQCTAGKLLDMPSYESLYGKTAFRCGDLGTALVSRTIY